MEVDDGAGSWSQVDMGLGYYVRVFSLAVDPHVSTTLYPGVSYRTETFEYRTGTFKSTDGGTSWTLGNNGLGGTAHYALVISREAPAILYSGTDQGVFKSSDGGRNWSAVNSGLTTRVVLALAIDRETPANVYAGTAITSLGDWNNRDTGVFKTTDGGNSPQPPVPSPQS